MAENSKSPFSVSEYTEWKKYVGDSLISTASQSDKALLALSGGAFGVSIAFLKDIAPDFDPSTKVGIIAAWGLYLFSLSLTLISFQTSARAFREFEKYIDAHHRSPDTAPRNFEHSWNRITERLNYASVACFMVGSICLATFSYHNLNGKEKDMPDEKVPVPVPKQTAVVQETPLAKGETTLAPPKAIQGLPPEGAAQGGAITLGPPVGPKEQRGAVTVTPPILPKPSEGSPEINPPPPPPPPKVDK